MPDEIILPAVLEPENQEETITMVRALCPWAETMTDEAVIVCVAFVEFNADLAMIETHTRFLKRHVSAVSRSRLGQRVIAELARQDLEGTGVMIALRTLKDVAKSPAASTAARVRASTELLSLAEAQAAKSGRRNKADGGKDLNTMTLAELQDFVEEIKQNVTMIDGMQNAIEHDPIDGTT
jgi:hypothetical protein